MRQKPIFSKVILLCIMLLMFFQPLTEAATAIRLDILSVNDFHGALLEEGKTPGAAKMASFMKELRSQNPHGTLILSAGDMFQGTVRSNILYGKPVIEMMNSMGFVAMALGNHEFDWGVNVLRDRGKEAKFPMMAANITNKDTGRAVDFAVPYIVKKVNGVNIGIIGLTTPETAYTSSISVVSKYIFADPAEAVKKVYRAVKGEGAEVIVVLSHLGSSQHGDVASGEAVDFINALNGSEYKVDAVVSAHTHNVVKSIVHDVPLVQAGYSGRNIGVITLHYSPEEKRVIKSSVDVLPVDAKQSTDRRIEKIVNRSAKKARPVENSVIGHTDGLDHDRHTVSPLGMWATDAMKRAAEVDIALTNGGGLRKPILPGKITLGTIYDIAPFDNTIITMKMTGKQIRELMEFGLDSELGVLQFSGLNIVYDRLLPKGKRIASIALSDGRVFSDDGVYSVCTNDFLADGGDGYVQFKEGKEIKNTNIVFRTVLVEAVEETDNIVFKDDGRFRESAIKKAA